MDAHPLRVVAQSLLDHRLPEIIESSMMRLIDDEPGYASTNLTELRNQMERTLQLALARLAGEEIPSWLASAAYENGQLRAHQGLELSSVLHSFRIDLRILWQAILQEGKELGFSHDQAFAESLLQVWEAVEANIADVVEGYRYAADRANRRLDEVRAAAFDRLILEGERDESVVFEMSRVLDLPVDGRYLCIVGNFRSPRPEILNSCLARLNQRSIRSHFNWVANELVGVVLLQDNSVITTIRYLEELQRFTCGVFDVQGLDAVPRGLRLARIATRGSTNSGILLLRHRWTLAMVTSDSELAESMIADVLSPIWSLPAHAREEIFETVEAFVSGDGSVADVAERTFRHRNTVRKRFQEIEELTGLSLSRPRDITTLNVAFDIYQSRRNAESDSAGGGRPRGGGATRGDAGLRRG